MLPPTSRQPPHDSHIHRSKGVSGTSALTHLTNAFMGSLYMHKGSMSMRTLKQSKTGGKVYADNRSTRSTSRRSMRRTSGRAGDTEGSLDPLRARKISVRERTSAGGDADAVELALVGADVQGQPFDRSATMLGSVQGESFKSSLRNLKSKVLGEDTLDKVTPFQQKQVTFQYIDDDLEGDNNDGNYLDEGDDSDGNDEDTFTRRQQALAAEEQDEVAYFSQRGSSHDFKVGHKWVLHPYGRGRAAWDCFLLVLITWMLISTPFELSFRELNSYTRRSILELDYVLDAMFAIDILLNFMTAVEFDGRMHFSYRSIRHHYISGWFVFDTMWTIPFYSLTRTTGADVPDFMSMGDLFRSDLYPLLRIVRLGRIASLPRIRRRLEFSLRISSSSSSLGGFVYSVLALSHLFSCMFAYLAFGDEYHLATAIADHQLQDDSIYSKYIASSYWSMMTIATVGYGDLTVKTNTGRLFSIVAMVIGGGIFAYGISNVVDLIQQLYVEETEHRHKMDQVNMFMHYRALPRKLRDEIRANFFHLRKATRENKAEDYGIIQQMSRTMQSHVADLFCMNMMPTKMPTLAGGNAEFIHELYLAMEVQCYLPGEDIIRQDDYGTELYFLFGGHVQVFVGHSKVALFGPNTCFGEFVIMNPRRPRLATIQAIDFCETHCISRQIVVNHPFVLRSIYQLVQLKQRKALGIMTDQTSKTRTLVQTLAAVWHTEGLQALLPTGVKIEDLPQLQEYTQATASVTPILPRLSSVRGGLVPTARRKSVSMTIGSDLLVPGTAGNGEVTATNASGASTRRRSSIHEPEISTNEQPAASPAGTAGNRSKRGGPPRTADILVEGTVQTASGVVDDRIGLILHQLNVILKRQDKFEQQLQQISEAKPHRGSVHVSYPTMIGNSDVLRSRSSVTDLAKMKEAPK